MSYADLYKLVVSNLYENKDHIVVTVLRRVVILSQTWFVASTIATIVSVISKFLIMVVPAKILKSMKMVNIGSGMC